MERGYVPSIWDIQPGGSSSQKQDEARASKRTVSGNLEDSIYNTNTLGEHERRTKLTQAYGRSLLSAIQSSQLPPSSSSNPSLMVQSVQFPQPSVQIPPPSMRIPPPSGRIPPSSVDESRVSLGKRSNPFPIEFERKRYERPKQEAPKPQVSSSAISSIPVHNVVSSTPVSPVTTLNADALRQQIMLAGINALAMNNPSLQAQLLLGENNTAMANNPSFQAQFLLGQNNPAIIVNNPSFRTQLLLGENNSAIADNPSLQAQLLGQNSTANNLPFLGVNMKSSVPDGSGLLKYRAPNMESLVFDHEAGYKFDPTTGLHYDANSGLFINLALKTFLRWDSISNAYSRVDLPRSGQAFGVGPISVNSDPVISPIRRCGLSKMNIQPTGIPEVIQRQATNLLSNPSSSAPYVQDSFMTEIWQRMRALAKEAIVDSQSTQNPGEAVRMKNEKLPDRSNSENSSGERRVKPKPSSSSRSRSASLEDRRKDRYKKRTSRSRSRSHSVESTDRCKGRKRSRSRSEEAGRNTRSRLPVRNRRRSRSRGARRSHSKGMSTHSRSPAARNRKRSRSTGARRNRSKGLSTHPRSPAARNRKRSRSTGARRSRSRGRRSISRARRSRSRRHRRSVSRSPGRGSGARRNRSRGAKRNRRSRSANRRSGSGSVKRSSRERRSLSRGRRGSCSTRQIISQSPGRHSQYTKFMKRDIPKDKRELKRKAGSSSPPNRQHFSSGDDHKTAGAVTENISYPALGKNRKKKNRGGKKQERSYLVPLSSSTIDGDTNKGDSDSLSDFDFLKDTLDDDNESVVVDEYEEALEHDESIFENKSPELRKDQTVDLGDVLGHIFPNDGHTFSNIILVAPVPLQNGSKSAKDLKNQIGYQEDVHKIHVFNKGTGSPCEYMLIFFRTTEAATQWYNSSNGHVILNSDDGSKMKGYLHFAESSNWHCRYCGCQNFLMRILCCKCYQAKDNQYSPVMVSKEPTKYVGIAKLKSCFPTTESVLDSLPSLRTFNIQNVQMITEPRNLPMGLCVFEVQSEAEGTQLFSFFREQHRACIYVMMNDKQNDFNAEENTDINPHEQNPHCTDYENAALADGRRDEEDSLAPLFTNETPKNVILVAPIPISKTLKTTKSELSLTESHFETALDDDGVKYDNITLHIDKNVGAPCSYGLIIFADSETAAKWREKHNNALNINITGEQFPTSAVTEPSLKVFLHFGENNWECQNCLTPNFFLRSLCHNCFFVGHVNLPGPITKSAMTSRWVATSRLTDWFAGNEYIAFELKKVMKDLKITKIHVLRDPKILVLPLGCVFETESLGESLRLREFLQRTGRFSWFVTTNQSLDEFTATDLITSRHTATGSGESTSDVVNDPGSINTPPKITGLRAKPITAETETFMSDTDDISELEPDKCCQNDLLWWSQDSVRYSDILNDLFVHNPLTRVSPGQTIFVGPLPNSLSDNGEEISPLLKILTDKLQQDNLPVSTISIHTGPLCGAPCTFGLVCFKMSHDAEAWHDKHKRGLILPRPQPIRKTPKPLPKENKLFKTFVYFCKTNWQCRSCSRFNFGLRTYCFNCLAAKERGPRFITFSKTPTNCVCIRKFKSWTVTEERLVAHYPFLKKHSKLFNFTVLKERSGIPLGTCLLETNNTSDAQLLMNNLRATEGKKVVSYGIFPVPDGLIMASNSGNTIDCEDGFKEMFSDDSPTKILFMGPVPGLQRNSESFYKALVTKDGADCEKVECCLAETVGAAHGYCLVHFDTLESATDWYHKCQGRVTLTTKASLDGKSEALNPGSAFLHFTENNWSCDCGSKNFPVRSICFKCYKERNVESAPFIVSSTPTKWLGVRLSSQWYPTTDRALCLSRSIYNQSRIGSIRLYNDPKIPRDFFAMYVIETLSVEGAQLLLDFYKSSRIARVTHFVDLKNTESGKVTCLSTEVTIQEMNCGDIPKPTSASNAGSLGRVSHTMMNKEVLVCPDHETILCISLLESRLNNNPPSSIVMISLCPGDRQLPGEARSQIQNSLQEAGVNHQSILYSFKGDVGSPFSYCLVSFGSVDSAKTWVDACMGTFQFNVPCPDDTRKPPNFQNFYSLKSSSGVDNTYVIKSKLHYSSSNWLCSCGTANFPLRSLCHNCFKNRDRESDYESIPNASRFVGIKLTEYRNLFDSNPISELRKSGHKILKISTCFDPALPRDPCGVVILEAQSIEFGTKLYDFLSEENGQNLRDKNCKRLMMLLEKSSGTAYFKCPKSLEPNWALCASQNLKSYFENELSNIITVDMDILGNFKFDIPLEQYGGRLKKYRNSVGFIPNFCFIYFPTPQAAKEWYDVNNGKLKNPITSAFHSLYYTTGSWHCPQCSARNFPARVLCHRCYRHKMEEFSPVRISKWPTRWVGITKDSRQKQAVASLVEDCREEDENFQLRGIDIFFDPNIRQDGICIFVFEVSSLVEGLQLKTFFDRRGVKCSFFELVLQSQALAEISEASTESDKLHGEVSEETVNASELEFADDILTSNQSPDRESNSSTLNPMDGDCMNDPKLADSPADIETVIIQSEGLSLKSVCQSGMSDEKLEKLAPKSTSKEYAELSIDCHDQKNLSLNSESQQGCSEPGASREIQLSSNTEVDPTSDVCAAPNESSVDSEFRNVESIPMDASEPNTLKEDQTYIIAGADPAEPSNKSQSSDDGNAPQTNPEHTGKFPSDDGIELHSSCDDSFKNSSAGDVGMVDPTSDSYVDIVSNPKIISETVSVQTSFEVDQGLEERVTPREPCLNSDSQNVESVPMNTSEPQSFPDDQASSKSEVNPGLQVCASPMDPESQNVECMPMDTTEPEAVMENHASNVDASVEVFPIPNKPCITESQEPPSTIVDADPSNSSQSCDDQTAPRGSPEHTGERMPDDDGGGGDDLKDSSAEEAGLVDPTLGPSWIPSYPSSAFVIGAPLTPRPSVNPNKDFLAQISKILTNDHADFKDLLVRKSSESGAPWHYSIVHFASADTAKTWLEKRGRQMILKQGARVRKDLTVHLYFGKDDWVCACGITNYFERTFCHGCFRLKTGAGFSAIMQSTIPTLWVAIRPSNCAKNVDVDLKNWMVNLLKAGFTFFTEPTFHSDPGIKGGDMYGVYIFKNSTLEESEKLLTWFNAKLRAMYVTPYIPSSSK